MLFQNKTTVRTIKMFASNNPLPCTIIQTFDFNFIKQRQDRIFSLFRVEYFLVRHKINLPLKKYIKMDADL